MADDEFADFDERFQDLRRRFEEREPLHQDEGKAAFEAQRKGAEADFHAEAGESRLRFHTEGDHMDQRGRIQDRDHQHQLNALKGEEKSLGERHQRFHSRLDRLTSGAKETLASIQDSAPGKRLQSQLHRTKASRARFRIEQDENPAVSELEDDLLPEDK